MAKINTLAGSKIAISHTVENADLTQDEFEALDYVDISNVGSLGPTGHDTNMVTYDTLADRVIAKQKGLADAGSVEIELARDDDDTGQQMMKLAGRVSIWDVHAFRITKQDASVEYLRGLVSGPRSQNGRGEDFDLQVYTIGVVQFATRTVRVYVLVGENPGSHLERY